MKTKQSAPSRKQLIHETNTPLRLHRIIIISEGRPDNGSWFEWKGIAMHKGYFANTDDGSGFPVGIFRTTPVTYEVLG